MSFQPLVSNVMCVNPSTDSFVAAWGSSHEINVNNTGGFKIGGCRANVFFQPSQQPGIYFSGLGAACIASNVGNSVFSFNIQGTLKVSTPPIIVAFRYQPTGYATFSFRVPLNDDSDNAVVLPLKVRSSFVNGSFSFSVDSTMVFDSTPDPTNENPVYVGFGIVTAKGDDWIEGSEYLGTASSLSYSVNQYLEQPAFFQPLK